MEDEHKPEPRPKKPSISDLLESHKITHGKLDEMIAAMKSAQTITDDEQVLHSGWRLAKKYPTTALLIIGIVFGPGWADSIIRVVKSLSGSPTPVKVESRVDYEYLMGHPIAGTGVTEIANMAAAEAQPIPATHVRFTTPAGNAIEITRDATGDSRDNGWNSDRSVLRDFERDRWYIGVNRYPDFHAAGTIRELGGMSVAERALREL